MTFRNLAELVNGNDALVRRGRYLTTTFVVGVGDTDWLISIANGRVADVLSPPPLMKSSRFAIRGSEAAWEAFWQDMPAPGFHDIFAMTKAGHMTIEGDLHPLMANLQYVKDVLAAPRSAS